MGELPEGNSVVTHDCTARILVPIIRSTYRAARFGVGIERTATLAGLLQLFSVVDFVPVHGFFLTAPIAQKQLKSKPASLANSKLVFALVANGVECLSHETPCCS